VDKMKILTLQYIT